MAYIRSVKFPSLRSRLAKKLSIIDTPVDVRDQVDGLLFTLLEEDEELGQHFVGLGRIGAVEPVLESSVGYAEIIGEAYLPTLTVEREAGALEKDEEIVLFHLQAYRKAPGKQQPVIYDVATWRLKAIRAHRHKRGMLDHPLALSHRHTASLSFQIFQSPYFQHL